MTWVETRVDSKTWMLAASLGLGACGDDGSAEATGSPASTGAESTSTTATSTGDSTAGSADSGPSTTTPSDTTGETMLCNGWSEDGPTTPWLELYGRSDTLLESGGTLEIECGGQGSWMYGIYPRMGGWELQNTILFFDTEVVVEGFPGPTGGSFFDEPSYFYELECLSGDDTFDGGFVHDCIAVIPPDGIPDLSVLDGLPATVHVEMGTQGGDPIVIDLDLTLSAPAKLVSEECF